MNSIRAGFLVGENFVARLLRLLVCPASVKGMCFNSICDWPRWRILAHRPLRLSAERLGLHNILPAQMIMYSIARARIQMT